MMWGRVWRDITGVTFAPTIAILGLVFPVLDFVAFLLQDFGELDVWPFIVSGVLYFGLAMWMIGRIAQHTFWRRRLKESLRKALMADGENAHTADDAFPVIPLWVTRQSIYCAGQNEVKKYSLINWPGLTQKNFHFVRTVS